MNNGLTTERAMLGVFSTTSYNTIGDAYGKKPKPDPRHLGRQMVMERPHRGLAGGTPSNALFDREFKSLHKGDKYEDRTMYYKTQPKETRKTVRRRTARAVAPALPCSRARCRHPLTDHAPLLTRATGLLVRRRVQK